ncbi:MAG: L-histidine N(alpha)-methyltransferase, partial [Acidobacteriota bacterium]|nr:L-histidine N(alpha)-methyltransferase [Acidobacteriota bacterium]
FDLHKNPRVIVEAYDDASGVTAEFNLNLLRRINRELGANFDLNKFSHYAIYHPIECAARSFLISCEAQTIHIEKLNRKFDFKAWEPIFMEISQKFSLKAIEDLAEASGFQTTKNFFDAGRYFVDSLWKTKKC